MVLIWHIRRRFWEEKKKSIFFVWYVVNFFLFVWYDFYHFDCNRGGGKLESHLNEPPKSFLFLYVYNKEFNKNKEFFFLQLKKTKETPQFIKNLQKDSSSCMYPRRNQTWNPSRVRRNFVFFFLKSSTHWWKIFIIVEELKKNV